MAKRKSRGSDSQGIDLLNSILGHSSLKAHVDKASATVFQVVTSKKDLAAWGEGGENSRLSEDGSGALYFPGMRTRVKYGCREGVALNSQAVHAVTPLVEKTENQQPKSVSDVCCRGSAVFYFEKSGSGGGGGGAETTEAIQDPCRSELLSREIRRERKLSKAQGALVEALYFCLDEKVRQIPEERCSEEQKKARTNWKRARGHGELGRTRSVAKNQPSIQEARREILQCFKNWGDENVVPYLDQVAR